MLTKRAGIAILTIIVFFLAQKGVELFKLFDWFGQLDRPVRAVVIIGVWYIAFPLLVMGLFHKFKNIFEEAGLSKNVGQGILVGFICSLPMLLGAGWLANFEMTLNFEAILTGCILAALGEEILYRSFLFGQLFRHARWGFLVAGLASALLFGSGHLYQSPDFATALGIFAVTFMGGMWFSWLYVEWGYNLWVPIGFHFFMNLSWNIFDVSDNALGDWLPNVFRIATITLSIVSTIWYKRATQSGWVVKDRRWWADDPDQSMESSPKIV